MLKENQPGIWIFGPCLHSYRRGAGNHTGVCYHQKDH